MNISIIDQVLCYKNYVKGKITAPLTYRKVFVNYFNIIMHVLRNRYPFEAILRGGNIHITLHNYVEVIQISSFIKEIESGGRKELEYDILKDSVSISYLPYLTDKTSKINLYNGISNGEVFPIFIDNVYKNLPVDGKLVIDVGANIGDSSIYFALRGARKVIGLEPFPKSYKIAKKNIESNNLSDKIVLLPVGCSANAGYTNIDSNCESNISSYLTDTKNGQNIRLLSLEDILNEYSIPSVGSVLKMDCEGCEYDAILSTPKNVLRQFSHMYVEYHYGYKNLKEELEKCGFSVLITRPMLVSQPMRKKMYIGEIYAERN